MANDTTMTKRAAEHPAAAERTWSGRHYRPHCDIVERDDELRVVADVRSRVRQGQREQLVVVGEKNARGWRRRFRQLSADGGSAAKKEEAAARCRGSGSRTANTNRVSFQSAACESRPCRCIRSAARV